MDVTIRPATESDLHAVADIYAREVRTGIATFDLEPPPLSYWRARLDSDEPGDHLLVAEGDAVLGYAYSSAYRPRPAYHLTRETSIYLAEPARGRGVGRRLYDDLLTRLEADGMHCAVALVALPNPASEALHRTTGFRHLGTMTEVGRKFDRWVDTAWFELHLPRSLP
ncbi:MAG: N-acetyltransferase family protein [Nocardioidaceae bacterium]